MSGEQLEAAASAQASADAGPWRGLPSSDYGMASKTARPPLVELTPEQAKTLAAELRAIGFTMPDASEK